VRGGRGGEPECGRDVGAERGQSILLEGSEGGVIQKADVEMRWDQDTRDEKMRF
jgi:hypothetical protein